jgi:hypothetical protein
MANTFKLKTKTGIGTTPTTIYTASTGSLSATIVVGLVCSNITASAVDTDVQIENDDGDNIYIVKDAPIPAKGSLEALGGGKIVLEANDLVKVTSSAASSVDVALSIMEITT